MSIIDLAGDIGEMEEFEPLPEGLYTAEMQDVEIRYSDKVPQGYCYCQLRISPDEFPADYDVGNAPDGLSLIYARTSLPDAANRRTIRPFKQFLKAFGLDPSDVGTKFDPQALVGQECQVLLKRSEWQGAFINNVEAVQPLPVV